MAEETDEVECYAGGRVGAGKHNERNFGVNPSDGDEHEKHDDSERRLLAGEWEILEAVVTDGASHEGAESKEQNEPGNGPAVIVQRNFESVDDGSDDARGSWRRHSNEIF